MLPITSLLSGPSALPAGEPEVPMEPNPSINDPAPSGTRKDFLSSAAGASEAIPNRLTSLFLTKPYQAALKGDWDEVIKFFEKHQNLLMNAATGIRDTLLHLALHSKKEKPLKQLLPYLENLRIELHTIKNVYGNTLLHEAAITGNLEAAKLLVEKSQDLLIQRNIFGETPLFRAAAFGHYEMVKFLGGKHGAMVRDNQQLWQSLGIRKDNTSTLHIAVQGQHYDTALLLLKLDNSLMYLADPNNRTALHLLAETPSAFRSGCSMGLLKQLLYDCLVVEEEEEDDDDDDDDDSITRLDLSNEDKESGQIGKQSSYISDCLKNGCKGLKRFYLSRIKFLCKGWSLLNNLWQTKRKHAFAFRLAKKLIKRDYLSWNQSVSVEIDNETGFYLIKALSDGQLEGKDAGKGEGEGKKNIEQNPTNPNRLFLETFKGAVKVGKEMLKEYPMAVEHIENMKDQVSKVALNRSNDHEDNLEAPLLIATRNGIKEIVMVILEEYPQAVELINKKGQNLLHLAIRHRQEEIFNVVCDMGPMLLRRLTQVVDDQGCSLLHYVADTQNYVRRKNAGPALELQDELKWFERVEKIIPPYYPTFKKKQNGLTAAELFELTHKKQLNDAVTWIKETSQSCSTVSALVATVVFAAAYTVPGGYNNGGIPVFLHSPYFMFFAIMDVVALACSLTAVVMFLSVLTSTFEQQEFRHSLPRKLTFGLTLLFVSVLTTMLAFGATILLTINLEKKWTTSLISVAAFIPVSVFALMQFHLYFSFLGAVMDFWKEIKNALPLCCVRASEPIWN